MDNDIIKTDDNIHKKAYQEQIERYKNCDAAVHFVAVDGTNYSVMSLFDRRDEQTARDKIKYLIE